MRGVVVDSATRTRVEFEAVKIEFLGSNLTGPGRR